MTQKKPKAADKPREEVWDALPRPMHHARRRVRTIITQESLTKQQFKEECDVNRIVKAAEATGSIQHLNPFEGNYGDFTQAPDDYQQALHQVMEAQEQFDALPSKIRAHFENDPAKFLGWQNDSEAVELMRKHGLLKKQPEEVVEPVPKKAAKPPKQPAGEPPTSGEKPE